MKPLTNPAMHIKLSCHPNRPARTAIHSIATRASMTFRTVVAQHVRRLRTKTAATSTHHLAALLHMSHTALVLPRIGLALIRVHSRGDRCDARLGAVARTW